MKFYKISYVGKATSITLFGQHFHKDRVTYLTREEIAFPLYDAAKYGLKAEEMQAEERPKTEDAGDNGIMWDGMSLRKTNDWGTFLKGVPRFDVPAEAMAYLVGKPGWSRVGK